MEKICKLEDLVLSQDFKLITFWFADFKRHVQWCSELGGIGAVSCTAEVK